MEGMKVWGRRGPALGGFVGSGSPGGGGGSVEGMKVWGKRGPVLGGLVGCQYYLGRSQSVDEERG